jgi:hypothetical protein
LKPQEATADREDTSFPFLLVCHQAARCAPEPNDWGLRDPRPGQLLRLNRSQAMIETADAGTKDHQIYAHHVSLPCVRLLSAITPCSGNANGLNSDPVVGAVILAQLHQLIVHLTRFQLASAEITCTRRFELTLTLMAFVVLCLWQACAFASASIRIPRTNPICGI